MRKFTRITKAREQFKKFRDSSRKCPICNDSFKSEKCKHSHEEAKDFLFDEYMRSILGMKN